MHQQVPLPLQDFPAATSPPLAASLVGRRASTPMLEDHLVSILRDDDKHSKGVGLDWYYFFRVGGRLTRMIGVVHMPVIHRAEGEV